MTFDEAIDWLKEQAQDLGFDTLHEGDTVKNAPASAREVEYDPMPWRPGGPLQCKERDGQRLIGVADR